jgi:N-methylhydantoinase B
MFGALAQALGGRVPAESAGSIWVLPMAGARLLGKPFNVLNVGLGGTGARPGKDGLNTTAFPSGVGVVPVEITETESPLVFWVKEYLPDSGGPGEFRGGLGQRIEIGNSEAAPFTVGAGTFDRMRNPAAGRSGGRPGRHGAARLGSGTILATKAVHTVPAGDRIVLDLPGGGGVGDPARRARARVDADLAAGLVSADGAERDYGHEA